MLARAFVAPLCLSLAACSAVLDLPDDPRLVAPSGNDCLESAPAKSVATVRVYACDFVAECASAVQGLSARLCRKRDVDCAEPLQEGITDEDGLLVFDVETGEGGFDGYLEVVSEQASCTDEDAFGEAAGAACDLAPGCDREAPDASCQLPTYARALLFFNPPVRSDITEPLALPLLKSVALPAIVEAAGAEFDPATGNLFITALDCSGTPAPGVTYELGQHGDDATGLYVNNGIVNDAEQVTDGSGVGGFVGVPAGFVDVVGFDERMNVLGEIGLLAAPFTLTYSALAPR